MAPGQAEWEEQELRDPHRKYLWESMRKKQMFDRLFCSQEQEYESVYEEKTMMRHMVAQDLGQRTE